MKDAYYFPHDSNAKDDPKIINMIEQHGPEAYGIYWILIETLRDQPEFKAPINILPGLARRYNTTFDKMRSVVVQYGLFEISHDEFFFSLSLNRRMNAINVRRQKLSEAGKKGNQKRWNELNTIATQSPSDRHPIASKGKESKEKESKLNESIGKQINAPASDFINLPIADTDPELIQFFTDYGSTAQEASSFYNHYHSQGWLKSNGIPVTNWQSIARKWIDRERFGTQPYKSKPKSIGEIMSGYNL